MCTYAVRTVRNVSVSEAGESQEFCGRTLMKYYGSVFCGHEFLLFLPTNTLSTLLRTVYQSQGRPVRICGM